MSQAVLHEGPRKRSAGIGHRQRYCILRDWKNKRLNELDYEERDQPTILFRGQGAISSCALHTGKVYLIMNLLRNNTEGSYVLIATPD